MAMTGQSPRCYRHCVVESATAEIRRSLYAPHECYTNILVANNLIDRVEDQSGGHNLPQPVFMPLLRDMPE